ncbi:FAD-binding oxidoreductase [Rossellomorea vietnamensis]|uniref:FAD-binding oxidoreductase n=1 Tax=Rossellomorea vietnamensis TaxID=218284 RepID=UPI002D1FBC6A|nr:FAD-binding oxidoreductase [Rossellomorea vietnamensis]MCC5804177.1 FAD-binding oxidoreductase [Rossellomorea vietnamensis]
MRKVWMIIIPIVLSYILIFQWGLNERDPKNIITDVSRLMPTKIDKIVKGSQEKGIVNALSKAREENLRVSIAGKRHSQGGHTYYPDGMVLDMTGFNVVLDVDPSGKTVHVQSGATWDDIQKAINPYGLSVKVMQSQNIFTIGGSLSVNAHGRDIRNGSLIETVNWFRLLKPDGEIIIVSRSENEELFPLVIGGYGLFGVILDVELQLTSDELLTLETEELDVEDYEDYFSQTVLKDEKVRMHLARLSTAPDTFLKDMYVTNYRVSEDQEKYNDYNTLKKDEFTGLTKFSLGLSRNFDWGKNLFWDMQKSFFVKSDGNLETRNNVMRSESKFLEYKGENDTDILQEYFVPVDEYEEYIDDLREYLVDENINLMNITVRYVNQSQEAVLSYAKEDMFALVLLINQGLGEEERKQTGETIRGMIDITIEHGGSYYLPYYQYPTHEQLHQAYPKAEQFFQNKRQLDPDERFVSIFYEVYGK